MHFNPYGGEAARLAAALVNNSSPWTPRELEPILAAHGIVECILTPAQTAEIWEWSRRLAPCFGELPLEQRCSEINKLLADAASQPYISTHDGHPHMHYSALGADPASHIKAVTAAGLAYVVCSTDPSRLGRCARSVCTCAFVDTSRNGRRVYCTVRCANNDAVARHRASHAAPAG
ncbi:CGNR zinc finger domain-containing protein [Streptomyces rhizosphaericus]|uniref:CGNR zinc finger domain-containing protein n=1 Tax=Streptomyces rhizosphaericus TaxID=114699 RepID=A0A6G4AWB7_9ACTN|nr:CGNR zinc finger domain-containing protein [Streptomyces rhizosphaericus]NEW77723.1 CGNR zinc finger domain-containing protein [Streptomyces rhizosphaericus]